MGAVLAIVAFLMAGCAATSVNIDKFDFTTMRAYEDANAEANALAMWLPSSFRDSKGAESLDMGFAYYYGAQGAIADGEYEKAEAHLKTALEYMNRGLEDMKILLEGVLDEKEKPEPEGITL